MSFDLYIGIKLQIDSETGLPFIWGPNSTKIPYDTNVYKVPEQFKRLIWQRGLHFHVYVNKYHEDWEYETSAADFLHNYPNWTDVTEAIGPNNDWTEADHAYFKAALEWFASKEGYYLFWSY